MTSKLQVPMNQIIPSSATQSLRAMIYASYVSALSSATGREVSTLPYTSKHNIHWGEPT